MRWSEMVGSYGGGGAHLVCITASVTGLGWQSKSNDWLLKLHVDDRSFAGG